MKSATGDEKQYKSYAKIKIYTIDKIHTLKEGSQKSFCL